MKFLLSFLLLITSLTTFASEPYFCTTKLDDMPIQQRGRTKPLYVHANETIKYLFGKKKLENYNAVELYCLLSLESFGMTNKLNLKTRIDHVDVRKFVGLSDKDKTISFKNVLPKKDELLSEWRKAEEYSSYKKSLNDLLSKMSLYDDIIKGSNWMLPNFEGKKISWSPLKDMASGALGAELQGSKELPAHFKKIKENFKSTDKSNFYLELRMVKWRLPVIALLLTLLAMGAMGVKSGFKFALGFSVATIVIQTLYLTFRVLISGRAPITNMYETVIFSGYAALIIALLVGHFKKQNQYVTAGLMYNLLTLMMINFAGNMLSSSISPLVPVLRDNFWLSTHVTSIIISYGALALSWLLANVVLFKALRGNIDQKEVTMYSDQIYICIIYGAILLAAGIILGGVWADYSWGRFWGWDPKETWSLIVLCIYMAILHGKYTSWIPEKRFVPLTAGAFLSVMMAWFGVNYILASGLHSYGFSEGGAVFLGTFFLVQIVILIVTTPKLLKMK